MIFYYFIHLIFLILCFINIKYLILYKHEQIIFYNKDNNENKIFNFEI